MSKLSQDGLLGLKQYSKISGSRRMMRFREYVDNVIPAYLVILMFLSPYVLPGMAITTLGVGYGIPNEVVPNWPYFAWIPFLNLFLWIWFLFWPPLSFGTVLFWTFVSIVILVLVPIILILLIYLFYYLWSVAKEKRRAEAANTQSQKDSESHQENYYKDARRTSRERTRISFREYLEDGISGALAVINPYVLPGLITTTLVVYYGVPDEVGPGWPYYAWIPLLNLFFWIWFLFWSPLSFGTVLFWTVAWIFFPLLLHYLWFVEKEKKKAEAARIQHHKQKQIFYKHEQERYYKDMLRLRDNSLGLFESSLLILNGAVQCLDEAERYFDKNAYIPFWDSIEKAANLLAKLNKRVRDIQEDTSRFMKLTNLYQEEPPQFSLAQQSVLKLGEAGCATSARMDAIRGKALGIQDNIDKERIHRFSDIYLKYKNNKILIAGFNNLNHALERMTDQITASITNLDDSIGEMDANLYSSLSQIRGTVDTRAVGIQDELSASSERERRALQMLDNIQCNRRPLL